MEGKWACAGCADDMAYSKLMYSERLAQEQEGQVVLDCQRRIASQWRTFVVKRRYRRKRASIRLLQGIWRRKR
jgi:hypothetical protein